MGKADQASNTCIIVSNVTEVWDVPITMGIVPIWLYHKNNPNNRICAEEQPPEEGKVWYLLHHGIYHPRKPNILRVVFVCSAWYQEELLNDHLLQGPDLSSKLTGVLTRFRKERVAFMFFQVKVKKEDQNFFRFLWWSNGDLIQEAQEHCMKVHLFGAGSSPGCSNFALKQTFTVHRWLSWLSIGLSCGRSWVRLRPDQHSGS